MHWRTALALAGCLGSLPLRAAWADDKPVTKPEKKVAAKAD